MSRMDPFNPRVGTGQLPINEQPLATGPLNMNAKKVTNLAAPTVASDATTKSYVDSAIQAYIDARTARGTRLMSPTAANTMVTAAISFGKTLPAVPNVTCSPSTVANSQCFAYPTNITTTGFQLNFRRDATTATNVEWIASAL